MGTVYPIHLGAIIAVVVLIVIFGILASRRVKNSEDMLVSGRSLGLFFVACALSAEYMGGLGTIGVSARAYNDGMGVVWFHIAAATGILVFGLLFAHYYRKYGIQTVPEYLYYLFDIKTWKANALLNFIAYALFTVVEVVALGSILAGITGLGLELCAVVASVFVTLYVLVAGMWSIAYVSMFYMALIYLGLPLAFYYVLQVSVPELDGAQGATGFQGLALAMRHKGLDPDHLFSPFSLSPMVVLGFFIGGVFAVPAAQATVNYAFGARNWKIARLAPILAAFLVVPLSIWTGTMGLFAKTAGLTDNPKLALVATLTHIPVWVGAIGSLAIFAAIISTADSILFAAGSLLAKDILQRWLNPKADDKKVLLWTRVSVFLVGGFATVAAIGLPDLLGQAYFVYSLRAVTLVCVFFGIYYKRAHPDAAFWSIIVSFVAATLYYFDFPIRFFGNGLTYKAFLWDMHISVFTVIIAVPVFVVISLFRRWHADTAGTPPPLYREQILQ
ncbi:MAG: sodium:solute symporter family protein [Myxococcota bacterium]|nr:sodium:solute symporter family protein [Myxococcota bacterium]